MGSKITTSLVGVIRLGIVILEAFHITAEEMDHTGTENQALIASKEETPATLMPTFAVVGTFLGLAGSITQLCLYELARNHSKEVYDYLEEHNKSRVSIPSMHTLQSMHLWCP